MDTPSSLELPDWLSKQHYCSCCKELSSLNRQLSCSAPHRSWLLATSPGLQYTSTFSAFSPLASSADGQASTLMSKPRPTSYSTQVNRTFHLSHKSPYSLPLVPRALIFYHFRRLLPLSFVSQRNNVTSFVSSSPGGLNPCCQPLQSKMATYCLAATIIKNRTECIYSATYCNIIHQYIHI